MEGDDGQSSAGIEAADRSLHHAADGAELIVHGDADGLKASLCGVLLFAQRLRGHGRANNVDQLQRRFDGRFLTRPADGCRDLRCIALLAVIIENAAQLALRPGVDDRPRRERVVLIHTHIERGVRHVGKAARSIVELRRRNAEVEQHAVHGRNPKGIEDRVDLRKIGMHERHAVGIGG